MAKSKYDDEKFIGFISGKLQVVEVGLRKPGVAHAIWRCRCSCNGNIKEYKATAIYNKHTQSCGCELINNKCSIFDNKEYIGKIYGDLQVESIVKSNEMGIHWKCRCKYCNDITIRKAQDVVNGKTTRCRNKSCIRERNKTNIKYNKDEYIGKEYNLLKVLDYYIDTINGYDLVMWKCKCLNCGNIVNIRASQVANSVVVSCGCLHKSKHEVFLEDIFKKYNIQYRKEVSFNDLKGIGGGKPRFDFAIIDRKGNKKLIEYDGKQHFIEAFETSTWNTKRTLENDKIKDRYCAEKGIELIRINKEFNTMEDMYKYLIDNDII